MKSRQFFEINRVMAILVVFSLIVLSGCAEHKKPMMDDMNQDSMPKGMQQEQPMKNTMMKDDDSMQNSMDMKKGDTKM